MRSTDLAAAALPGSAIARGALSLGHPRDGNVIMESGSANDYDYEFLSRVDPQVLRLLRRVTRSLR